MRWLLPLLLAACLTGPPADTPEAEAIGEPIGEPIVMDHDHLDLFQHTASHGLQFAAWSTLDVELGQNGFANFVFYRDEDEKLAFVAVDGDTEGGFVIADIADPAAIKVLGRYWVDGNSIQEVRVSPDGNWALMNVQDVPDAGSLSDVDGASDCTLCIHVVDVRDRSAPELVQVLPVELLGTHNLDIAQYGGATWVFWVGQPLYNPFPDPGNHVWIGQLLDTPEGARLIPVSSLDHNEPRGPDSPRTFPHDVMVQEHPDGRMLAYVSHWDGGMVVFDVSDPVRPSKLGVNTETEPSEALAIHWAMQEPAARADGRVYAWSAPEIGALETGSGVIRAYDVTDPAAPAQVGTWELPGNVTILGRYIFSPHTAVPDMRTGLLAVSHYHAGVWILNITDPTDPRHTAYYQPHGDPDAPYEGPIWWKKPNFSPDGYAPNVYQARWDPDDASLLWVTDRSTGLYALEYTGPVPGLG